MLSKNFHLKTFFPFLEPEDVETCCTKQLTYLPGADVAACPAIPIPPNDPIYAKYGGKCLPFTRTETNIDSNCSPDFVAAQQVIKQSNVGMYVSEL